MTTLNSASQADAVVVLTTVATAEDAARLVRVLLERRLVACGTLIPGVRSLYWWNDDVADEREVVVLLKTRGERLEALGAALAELHPYQVPELLALPVAAGLPAYLEWLAGETAVPAARGAATSGTPTTSATSATSAAAGPT